MLQIAIEEEIPRELAWLRGYDRAFASINAEFDLPHTDIGRLVRMIQGNDGQLSQNKRKQFAQLPDRVIERIESIVREAFAA